MEAQHLAPADAGGPRPGPLPPGRAEPERHREWLAARQGPGQAERPLVLIVEDEENIRTALQALLETSGYRVAATALGEEAVRVAPVLRPDVVLLDLVLPRRSGLDTVRCLKEDPATASIPVVAMTALWLAEHTETLAAAGFQGALRKPYTTAELFAELERALAPDTAARDIGAA
ncbi:MAG TPA: response regulator [Longimicrobiaceae bacterium]|nr:response regulator [Longimicrobiaceae bacterium]